MEGLIGDWRIWRVWRVWRGWRGWWGWMVWEVWKQMHAHMHAPASDEKRMHHHALGAVPRVP